MTTITIPFLSLVLFQLSFLSMLLDFVKKNRLIKQIKLFAFIGGLAFCSFETFDTVVALGVLIIVYIIFKIKNES